MKLPPLSLSRFRVWAPNRSRTRALGEQRWRFPAAGISCVFPGRNLGVNCPGAADPRPQSQGCKALLKPSSRLPSSPLELGSGVEALTHPLQAAVWRKRPGSSRGAALGRSPAPGDAGSAPSAGSAQARTDRALLQRRDRAGAEQPRCSGGVPRRDGALRAPQPLACRSASEHRARSSSRWTGAKLQHKQVLCSLPVPPPSLLLSSGLAGSWGTASTGSPEASVPHCPGHQRPNPSPWHGGGCLHPPHRDVTPSVLPAHSQGARLRLCSGAGLAPVPPAPLPARGPAAAYQDCKIYWKSCGCKSRPPTRARNRSCNPERAAGSEHAASLLAIARPRESSLAPHGKDALRAPGVASQNLHRF